MHVSVRTLPGFIPAQSHSLQPVGLLALPDPAQQWDDLGAGVQEAGRTEEGGHLPLLSTHTQQAPKPGIDGTHLSPRHWAPACSLVERPGWRFLVQSLIASTQGRLCFLFLSLHFQGPCSPLSYPQLSAELDVGHSLLLRSGLATSSSDPSFPPGWHALQRCSSLPVCVVATSFSLSRAVTH